MTVFPLYSVIFPSLNDQETICCGPLRTYFSVVFPMLRPTMISVGILEIMWVWNDYLLPYLVLDRTKYMLSLIHI